MHKKKLAILTLVISTSIAACSSKDEALKTAIAAKLATEGNALSCASVMNDAGSFPLAYHTDGMLNYGADKKVLDHLVKEGFLTTKDIMVKSVYGGLNGETVGSPQAIEYSLTASGQRYAQGNKFCIPSEMAATKVEAEGSERSLLVSQYFSAIKTDETERLSEILKPVNPNLSLLMEQDLAMKFRVQKTIKHDIVSIEKIS